MASSADSVLSDGMERVAVLAIVLAIAAVTLSLFLGAVAETGTGGSGTDSTQEDLLVSGGDVTLSGDNVSDPTVKQSLNDSAQLDGSGAITGELGADVAANRTVSTWARVDNTSGVRQVVSVDSRTILVYNGTSSDWACWSYDDGTGQTHRVAVNATSPGALTNLQCERASGALTLRVNDTSTTSVQTDSANATAQTLQTEPLDGRIDETRTFNGTLTSAEQSALYTAPTGLSILPGITRASIIALAEERGYEVEEKKIPREALYTADELFFTGTAAEVTPIRTVDDYTIGSGSRGPVTKEMQDAFFEVVEKGHDPHDWLTFVDVPAADEPEMTA